MAIPTSDETFAGKFTFILEGVVFLLFYFISRISSFPDICKRWLLDTGQGLRISKGKVALHGRTLVCGLGGQTLPCNLLEYARARQKETSTRRHFGKRRSRDRKACRKESGRGRGHDVVPTAPRAVAVTAPFSFPAVRVCSC